MHEPNPIDVLAKASGEPEFREVGVGPWAEMHGIDGVCNDIELTLHTSDFLVGERDSGQIAQMYYFFACECRHSPNYTNQM